MKSYIFQCVYTIFYDSYEGLNKSFHFSIISPPPLLFCPSSGDNGSMYFWDWKTGYNFQKIQTTVQPGSLDSEAGIFQCCFDQSGCRLLTAEADKTIKIYKEDDTAVSCCNSGLKHSVLLASSPGSLSFQCYTQKIIEKLGAAAWGQGYCIAIIYIFMHF